VRAFAPKRFVKICTKRFRIMTATANALAVRADALHAADAGIEPERCDE
jgi:hypothetical protein